MSLPTPEDGSTALITGASSGIGAALAREFAGRGHGVTLVARGEEPLRALADELASQHGVRAEAIACDVTDPAARDRLAAAVDAAGLRVDVLANNAGFGTYKPFVEIPRERLIEETRVNTEAVVDLTARWLPGMVERGAGAVLVTASTAAFQPLPGNALYAGAKSFALVFAEGLHHEVKGAGVTVTALCPGPVASRTRRMPTTSPPACRSRCGARRSRSPRQGSTGSTAGSAWSSPARRTACSRRSGASRRARSCCG